MEKDLELRFSQKYKKENIKKVIDCICFFFILGILSLKHILHGDRGILTTLTVIIAIGNLIEIINCSLKIWAINKKAYIKIDEYKVEIYKNKISKYEIINVEDIKSYTVDGAKAIILNKKNSNYDINLEKLNISDIDKLKYTLENIGVLRKEVMA